MPDREGEQPNWGSKPFPKAERDGGFVTLASGMNGDDDALPIRTNARVSGVTVKAGETVRYSLGEGRSAYLVPATGKVEVNGVAAEARDGVAIRDVSEIAVTAINDSEIILVDAA
jgi:redox-sensitive bicupin YhaK (pirin superfamily)